MDYYIKLPSQQAPFLPRQGEFLYYCYRKLPRDTQHQLMTLEHLQHCLITCAELYNEPAVAAKKLSWWIEECEAALAGNARPQHPVTVALQDFLADTPPAGPLLESIKAKHKLLQRIDLEDFNTLHTFIDSQTLPFEQARAYCLTRQPLNETLETWLTQACRLMEYVRFVYLLPAHKSNHLYFLPGSDATLTQARQSELLKSHWPHQQARAYTLLKQKEGRNLAALRTRLKLHWKLLKLMHRHHFTVDRMRIDLSPLQMLFA